MNTKKQYKKNVGKKSNPSKTEITLLFPNQLFEENPALEKKRPVYLVEDPRFFSDFSFHKQKLMLHRASMRTYADQLISKGYRVTYIEHAQAKTYIFLLQKNTITRVHYIDPVDTILEKRLKKEFMRLAISAIRYESPAFLSSNEWIKTFFKEKKRFSMRSFYIAQRKRLDILIKNGKPSGGSWSFDTKNRKPLPKNIQMPIPYAPAENAYTQEARTYVEKNFPKNPGLTDTFIHPITTGQAKKCLHDFLKNRLKNFGDYQDAIHHSQPFLFHSLLSSALNSGLLTPAYVIHTTLAYAQKKTLFQ